jgi:hypothetical protein
MADIQQAAFSGYSISPGCFMVFQTAHHRHARSIGAGASAAERRGYPNGVSSERSAYASKRKAGPEVP